MTDMDRICGKCGKEQRNHKTPRYYCNMDGDNLDKFTPAPAQWICSHYQTCQNPHCGTREPFTKTDYYESNNMIWGGFMCEFHNTGISDMENTTFVKAIPYPKEEKMEYEIIKPINAYNVYEEGMCGADFMTFLTHWEDYTPFESPPDIETILAKTGSCGRQWLLDHGFIKAKEPKVFYSIGDRFENERGGIYQLSIIGGNREVFLVEVGGTRGEDSFRSYGVRSYLVSDPHAITKNEFVEMTGSNDKLFRKI